MKQTANHIAGKQLCDSTLAKSLIAHISQCKNQLVAHIDSYKNLPVI